MLLSDRFIFLPRIPKQSNLQGIGQKQRTENKATTTKNQKTQTLQLCRSILAIKKDNEQYFYHGS